MTRDDTVTMGAWQRNILHPELMSFDQLYGTEIFRI